MNSSQLSKVRGAEVAIVFQDPMTSLNPVMTIGNQIAEGMQVNLGLSHHDAIAKRQSCWNAWVFPTPPTAWEIIPISSPAGCASVS